MGSITEQQSYLIIGAGCFGASTAYHLAQVHPSARITLIDRAGYPNPTAAAHDINKIIRADYPDPLYMELALEAQDQWRKDPIFSPFYHEPGMLFAEDFGMGRDALANYQRLLGDDCPARMLNPAEAQRRFPMFRDANWEGVKQNYYDPTSGWGEADKALDSLIQAALNMGVTYVADPVVELIIDDHTQVTTGVLTQNGKTLNADRIIMSVSAYTENLLADSAPETESLQARDRLVAAAAVSCYVEVPESRRAPFQHAPVMFNGLDHTHASGRWISVPPNRQSASVWSQDVPEKFKAETRTVMKHIYGNLVEGLTPVKYRMCWDTVTPNQDWIISPHPHSRNLYIASGGSFHAWKFLPNIGKYVVKMLDGVLDEQKQRKWAWDRPDDGAACEIYIPTRDLKDFEQSIEDCKNDAIRD